MSSPRLSQKSSSCSKDSTRLEKSTSSERLSSQPSQPRQPSRPTRKTSSEYSPAQLSIKLNHLREQSKLELSQNTESCYVHFRDEGAAMKETSQQSPRTKHIQKMPSRTVGSIDLNGKTVTLTEPVEALIKENHRSEDCLDVSQLTLFQEHLKRRDQLIEEHNPSPEKLEQLPDPVFLVKSGSHEDEPKRIVRKNSRTIRLIQPVEPTELIDVSCSTGTSEVLNESSEKPSMGQVLVSCPQE
jgi:hypothetical protein